MSRWRTILAFLVAPAIVPLIEGAVHYHRLPTNYPDAELVALGTVKMIATFTYVISFVIGLPALAFLKYRKWWTFASVVTVATVIGTVLKAKFQFEFPTGMPREEVLFSLQMVATWGVSGAITGSVFWLIACPNVAISVNAMPSTWRERNIPKCLSIFGVALFTGLLAGAIFPLTMLTFFFLEFSGGLGSMSKPLAAIQIEFGERDPAPLVAAIRDFGNPEGFKVRGGKYPNKQPGHQLDMTLERSDGTRIEIKSGTQFDMVKRPGEYDAIFYFRKEGANWEDARNRLLVHLQTRFSPDIIVRRRDPAYPRSPPP